MLPTKFGSISEDGGNDAERARRVFSRSIGDCVGGVGVGAMARFADQDSNTLQVIRPGG